MLQPIMHILAAKRIVLASGSPRRKQILSNIGLKFEVMPSTFEENLDKSSFQMPYEYVCETARQKAYDVASRLKADQTPPDLVIAADTIVTMNQKIFEKPRSKEDAFEMLSGFSGGKHIVYTGVALVTPKTASQTEGQNIEDLFNIYIFHEATEVKFAALDSTTIRAYIETGEPMDKAGGYGIQAAGGTLIESITGDYFNVMGFPLHRFAKHMLGLFPDTGSSCTT